VSLNRRERAVALSPTDQRAPTKEQGLAVIRLVFVLLLLCSFSVLAQQPEEDPAQRVEIRSAALDAIQQSVETIASNSSSDESAQQRQETREGEALDIAGQDLAQQTRMATATEKLADDSRVQVIFAKDAIWINTGALLLILVGTIISAISAIAAKRSADAAMLSARQDRAWMCVKDNPAIEHALDTNTNRTLGMKVDFAIMNVGKSPAFAARAKSAIRPTIGVADRERVLKEMRERPATALGPDQSIFVSVTMNNEATVDLVVATPHQIYICCEYTTVYGEVFLTEETIKITMQEPVIQLPRDLHTTFDSVEGWNHVKKIGKTAPPV
jgi:hypothetical protein